jgi:hypothetical protein
MVSRHFQLGSMRSFAEQRVEILSSYSYSYHLKWSNIELGHWMSHNANCNIALTKRYRRARI